MYLLWFFFSLLSRTSYAQLLSKKAARSSRNMAGNAEFGPKNYDEITPFGFFFGVRKAKPERIYNPITAMGFSAMLTFQLDNTKR
jgi:hypothetical protein